MDMIEELANAANLTYAEIFLELYIDPGIHSEMFQKIFNESYFDKKIHDAFYSFKASFPEIEKMIYPVYSYGQNMSDKMLIENEVCEYHKSGDTYYIIEKTDKKTFNTGNGSDVFYISKKCSFKQSEDRLDYTDSIIDFSISLSDARFKLEKSFVISKYADKSIKRHHISTVINDIKNYFPGSQISQNTVVDILKEQKVYAI